MPAAQRVFPLVVFVIAQLATAVATAANTAPNIVFILADDLGWSELGCYGNRFHETPHLDELASSGVRFTQAYAAAPVCSPYRAAFLTGKYPARLGIHDYLRPNSANGLSTAHRSLAELLKQQGYTTGMIGKWHLTGYRHHGAEHETRPTDHGFDWNFGTEVKSVGNGANFWPYVFRDQDLRWVDIPEQRLGDGEYLTDRMNREAVDFIDRNRNRPFFLFLSHYAPHTILNGKPDVVAKYRQKHRPGKSTRDQCYLCKDQGLQGDPQNHWAADHNPHLAAMLESIDDGVGAIRAKLRELKLEDNTIVVFSSDNGGETNVTSNAPLRGGKSQLYEGGVRVPLIVSWPGKTPARAVCDSPTINCDFLPTFAEAAGVQQEDETVDGASMLDIWRQPNAPAAPRDLFWHYPLDRPHFLGGRSAAAIRSGPWKLIEFYDTHEIELYHLERDLSESKNIADMNATIAARLQAKLTSWRKEISARTPSPPQLTEPRSLYFADHFAPGQISPRWWFNPNWRVEKGQLERISGEDSSTRIFLKDAEFGNCLIRFDFQFRGAKDIRLVTGSGGHYNAVLHIQRDHFYLQTARDESVPYFPFRHGECRFDFELDRWYSMTVEFVDDTLIAHLDDQHIVLAKHPILSRTRGYFAFQVDAGAAAFDNVQILAVKERRDREAQLRRIQQLQGRFPVDKPLKEQLKIAKGNAHSRLYREDAQYRALVRRLSDLDAERKRAFPEAMKTHKEHRKSIAKLREGLKANDARYQKLLKESHAAKRAVEAFLISKQPEVKSLKGGPRNRALDSLRRTWRADPTLKKLDRENKAAQAALEAAFPQLFVSDKAITELQHAARRDVQDSEAFRMLNDRRAAAWRAQEAYLDANDAELARLRAEGGPNSR